MCRWCFPVAAARHHRPNHRKVRKLTRTYQSGSATDVYSWMAWKSWGDYLDVLVDMLPVDVRDDYEPVPYINEEEEQIDR